MQSSTPPASPNLSKFVTYEEGVYFHIVLERGKECVCVCVFKEVLTSTRYQPLEGYGTTEIRLW